MESDGLVETTTMMLKSSMSSGMAGIQSPMITVHMSRGTTTYKIKIEASDLISELLAASEGLGARLGQKRFIGWFANRRWSRV